MCWGRVTPHPIPPPHSLQWLRISRLAVIGWENKIRYDSFVRIKFSEAESWTNVAKERTRLLKLHSLSFLLRNWRNNLPSSESHAPVQRTLKKFNTAFKTSYFPLNVYKLFPLAWVNQNGQSESHQVKMTVTESSSFLFPRKNKFFSTCISEEGHGLINWATSKPNTLAWIQSWIYLGRFFFFFWLRFNHK